MDNKIYYINTTNTNDTSILEKLKYFEKYSLTNSILTELKQQCIIVYDNVRNKDSISFLYFNKKEKELLKHILERGHSNFYFCFRPQHNFEIELKEYSYNERIAHLHKYYGKTSPEYKNYKNTYRSEDYEIYGEWLEQTQNIKLPSNNIEHCIHLKINKINGLSLQTGNILYEIGKKTRRIELIFKNKYELLFNRGESFLANLRLKDMVDINKELDKMLDFIFLPYLKDLSKENIFIKDILKDYIENKNRLYVPIDFRLLKDAKNKKHLLELKMSSSNRKTYRLFNRFNKISLNSSYSLIQCEPYIKEKDISKISTFEYDDFIESESMRVISFLKEYIITNNDEVNISELRDYLKMLKCFKNKEFFNFNVININSLMKEHDRLSDKYSEVRYKKVKLNIKKDNIFLKLKIPKDIIRLKTKKDFYIEGKRQKHCVFTYIPKVNRGDAMIYTTIKDNKKYTIEIGKGKNGFIVNQIRGFANIPAPIEIEEYVKNIINENNNRLGYIKK